MKYTDTELETILSKLIASTRSPRGRFSAVASSSAVGKATKTTYPVFIPDAYAYIGSSGSCYSALSFGRNSIFIYATDFTPNSIHNGRNT